MLKDFDNDNTDRIHRKAEKLLEMECEHINLNDLDKLIRELCM
jgi:hypothetical protein